MRRKLNLKRVKDAKGDEGCVFGKSQKRETSVSKKGSGQRRGGYTGGVSLGGVGNLTQRRIYKDQKGGKFEKKRPQGIPGKKDS